MQAPEPTLELWLMLELGLIQEPELTLELEPMWAPGLTLALELERLLELEIMLSRLLVRAMPPVLLELVLPPELEVVLGL